MCVLRIYTKPLYTADHLLLCLHLPFCAGTCVCYKCDRHFFRDLTQIISIFLQVGVWLTPIMWDINMLSSHPWLIKLFKLNPMYYVVTGYRDSMLGHVGIWNHASWTIYFWVVTILLFGLGSVIFKRLKPHFADVL